MRDLQVSSKWTQVRTSNWMREKKRWHEGNGIEHYFSVLKSKLKKLDNLSYKQINDNKIKFVFRLKEYFSVNTENDSIRFEQANFQWKYFKKKAIEESLNSNRTKVLLYIDKLDGSKWLSNRNVSTNLPQKMGNWRVLFD